MSRVFFLARNEIQLQCVKVHSRNVNINHVIVLTFIADYSPINSSLTSSLSNDMVVVNTNFTLTCSAQANPPAKYRFYKSQELLTNVTSTDSSFYTHTTSVTDRVKQVNFSCTPFNYYGDGLTKVITVSVKCKYMYSV